MYIPLKMTRVIFMKSEKPQPTKTIWAFDLGKGSIGEAVRLNDIFPHAESLLIPAELARRGPATVSGTHRPARLSASS